MTQARHFFLIKENYETKIANVRSSHNLKQALFNLERLVKKYENDGAKVLSWHLWAKENEGEVILETSPEHFVTIQMIYIELSEHARYELGI